MCRRPSRSLNITVTALMRDSSVEILQPLFLNLVGRYAVQALLLRLQIHLFQFVVGDR
jgi:hypothetical protein